MRFLLYSITCLCTEKTTMKKGTFACFLFPLPYNWSKSPDSVRIRENVDQKKLRFWTLFTHDTV